MVHVLGSGLFFLLIQNTLKSVVKNSNKLSERILLTFHVFLMIKILHTIYITKRLPQTNVRDVGSVMQIHVRAGSVAYFSYL